MYSRICLFRKSSLRWRGSLSFIYHKHSFKIESFSYIQMLICACNHWIYLCCLLVACLRPNEDSNPILQIHCSCCLFANLQLHVHASHRSSPVEMVTAFQRFGAVTLTMTVATDQMNSQRSSAVSQGIIQLNIHYYYNSNFINNTCKRLHNSCT